METPVDLLAAALLRDLIYVCGGRIEGGHCIKSTYCYSPQNNKWTKKASLKQKRYGHGAVSINGELFVIGGCNDNKEIFLSSCEKYDSHLNTWSFIKPMLTPRTCAGVAVLDGKIYVCGGESYENNSTNSVEVYDPIKKNWIHVAPMNVRRSRFIVISSLKKLYAIGGFDWTEQKYLSSCEVYDPEKNSWSFVASLPKATNDMAGCSVSM